MAYFMNPGKRPKLGVIGAGNVVPFHLAAASAAGFKVYAIGSRLGSKRARSLHSAYSIPKVFDTWSDVIESQIDALLIAVPPDATAEILQVALDAGIPTLVEKPVALDAITLQRLSWHPNADRTLVGYNRRHYSSVGAAKELLRGLSSGVCYSAYVPEMSTSTCPTPTSRLRTLMANTVHVLDLLNYLFGSQEVVGGTNGESSEGFGWNQVLLRPSPGVEGITGNLNLTFGCPGTYTISISSLGRTGVLSPLEWFTSYGGMTVSPATTAQPIKRYEMTADRHFSLTPADTDYKPGFLRQYQDFRSLVEGTTSLGDVDSASLTDAARATELAAAIWNLSTKSDR